MKMSLTENFKSLTEVKAARNEIVEQIREHDRFLRPHLIKRRELLKRFQKLNFILQNYVEASK